jgi:pyruvate dehydrogenase E1 component beta subunit
MPQTDAPAVGSRQITYAAAIAEALHEEMARDPAVVVLGLDIGRFAGIFKATRGLYERFGPDRVRDTPISEAAIAGVALGASLLGMRPVAEIQYLDFMMIAADQVANHAAKFRYMFGGAVSVPVVYRTQGGSGRSNGAQHSASLEAWFVHTPGLKVVMPANPYDAKGLLKSAIRDNNPVVFIEHKLLYASVGPVPTEDYLVPLGVADVKRLGRDVTLVATSAMVPRALQAAARCSAEGIEVEVVDPRTLVPLDEHTILASVRRTHRALVVHEACKRCGWGAEMAQTITEKVFDDLDGPVVRLAGQDVPLPYAPELERAAVPQEDDIVQAIRAIARPR